MKHKLFCGTCFFLLLCFVGCSENTHEKSLAETAAKNASYQAIRSTFLRSPVYQTATDYVKACCEEVFPELPLELSLEPRELLGKEPPDSTSFLEDPAVRSDFFSKADLTVCMDLPTGTAPRPAFIQLIKHQISGRFFVEPSRREYYLLDADSRTVELIRIPEG